MVADVISPPLNPNHWNYFMSFLTEPSLSYWDMVRAKNNWTSKLAQAGFLNDYRFQFENVQPERRTFWEWITRKPQKFSYILTLYERRSRTEKVHAEHEKSTLREGIYAFLEQEGLK